MMSTTTAFRPRSVTEIVDAAIQVVRRNYVPLITVVAVAYVPFLILQMTAFRALLAAATTGQFLQLSGAQLVAYWAVSVVWFALIDSAVIVAAADAYLGRPVDVASTFRRALPRIGATVVAIVIKFMAIGFAIVFFVIPAFYVVALFYAVPCTTVLERAGPIAGLQRSVQLSRGLKGHVLLTLILVYGLYFVLIGGASLIFAMIGNRVAIQVFSALATILIYPFVPTVQMLLYYDARIRKEGYDIELMAQGVAGPSVTQPA
jgi:hypothetical protein